MVSFYTRQGSPSLVDQGDKLMKSVQGHAASPSTIPAVKAADKNRAPGREKPRGLFWGNSHYV